MAEHKRITLHPLDKAGDIDTSVNLYPKTLVNAIVNNEGEEVEVALKEDLDKLDEKFKPYPITLETKSSEVYDKQILKLVLGTEAEYYYKIYSYEEDGWKTAYFTLAYVSDDGILNGSIDSILAHYDSENDDTIEFYSYGFHEIIEELIEGKEGFLYVNGGELEFEENLWDEYLLDNKTEYRDYFNKVVGFDTQGFVVPVSPGTKLYRHHFDIILKHEDLVSIPSGMQVHINVNALSTDSNTWTKLGELDGGGFIVSAFGTISYPQVVTTHVFELKIYYKSLETLLLNVNDLTNNSVSAVAVTTVFGGTTPSNYDILDSVTPL